MTHDQLIQAIDDQEFSYERLSLSLIAVAKMHRPTDDEKYCYECRADDDWYSLEYPCTTLRAVLRELNA